MEKSWAKVTNFRPVKSERFSTKKMQNLTNKDKYFLTEKCGKLAQKKVNFTSKRLQFKKYIIFKHHISFQFYIFKFPFVFFHFKKPNQNLMLIISFQKNHITHHFHFSLKTPYTTNACYCVRKKWAAREILTHFFASCEIQRRN